MTLEEAVNDFAKWKDASPTSVAMGPGVQAAITLAQAYLHLTDPTPLSVALIERELGPAIRVDGFLHYWKVNGREFAFDGSAIVINLYTFFLHATLGDLRSIVRMLRKGGA